VADYDIVNDGYNKGKNYVSGGLPSIAALKAAIAGSPQAASYPARTMNTMTENDLIFVCRTHGIAVAGLIPGVPGV
jgi:hypothetical protein